MASLLFVVFLIGVIIAVKVVYHKSEDWGFLLGIVFGICCCAAFITMIILGVNCSELCNINSQIEYYEQENIRIQEEVQQTIDYKSGQYEAQGASEVTFLDVLRGDAWVQNRTDIYNYNSNKIRDLEFQKTGFAQIKWWLYFGG